MVRSDANPIIRFSPNQVDFGAITPGSRNQNRVLLFNDGQQNLDINSLGIQGGNGSQFVILDHGIVEIDAPLGEEVDADDASSMDEAEGD